MTSMKNLKMTFKNRAMKIYLTAGHNIQANGRGNGAFGLPHSQYPNGIDEAAEAIVLRNLITAHLRKHGLKVANDKDETPLRSVLTWLRNKATRGDWCIEIHFNAAAATASGVECVVENNHTTTESAMAQALCRAVNEATKQGGGSGIRIRERAPGRRGVVLERETPRGRIGFLHSPAVANNILLEVCFITNKRDVELYFNNRNRIAIAIAEHIIYHL